MDGFACPAADVVRISVLMLRPPDGLMLADLAGSGCSAAPTAARSSSATTARRRVCACGNALVPSGRSACYECKPKRVIDTSCGTPGGYRRHRRKREPVCAACYGAYRALTGQEQRGTGFTPCSACGKPLHGRRRPTVVCHECRRADPVGAQLECCVCGREFFRRDWWNLPSLARPCCSQSCSMKLRAWIERCRSGKPIGSASKASSRARRAAHALTWDGIADEEIIERDGWRCRMPECLFRSRVIPHGARYGDPRYRTVDHIVPLSLEGDDTAANKRAAHSRCNTARSNRIDVEQLPLFGTMRDAPVMIMAGTKRVVERKRAARHECCGVPVYRRHPDTCPNWKPKQQPRWSMNDARRARDMRLAGTAWREIASEIGVGNTGEAYLLAQRAGPLPKGIRAPSIWS